MMISKICITAYKSLMKKIERNNNLDKLIKLLFFFELSHFNCYSFLLFQFSFRETLQ